MVKQLEEDMLPDRSPTASGLLEYRHALSNTQFEQTLIITSSACNVDLHLRTVIVKALEG